jgi:hypothetical protein
MYVSNTVKSGEEEMLSREKRTVTNVCVEKVFLNIVLDDAVEEKDGGEKVRLGMVVRYIFCLYRKGECANGNAGHSWQLSRHARGTGENRWRTR